MKRKPHRSYDPKKLELHYEWIEKIVCFKLKNNVHIDNPTVWMSQRQNEKFKEFQRHVRAMAHSGEWGDYATVEVDPEIEGIIEDILGIVFADGTITTCYNCGTQFSDLATLAEHEETCGL